MNIAAIFAGGVGKRLNDGYKADDSIPKQFIEINNKPILIHTLLHFQNHEMIDKIYISMLPEYKEYTYELVDKYQITKVQKIVDGGDSAQESIYNVLVAIKSENPDDSVVLIHDGVRPIINSEVIKDNILSVEKYGNAITTTPCYETILVSDDGINPKAVPLRNETYSAQAPQSFRLKEILEAHEVIRQRQTRYDNIVDSCTLFHLLNKKTYLVRGNFGNIKITTPYDLYILKGILDYKKDIEIQNARNIE